MNIVQEANKWSRNRAREINVVIKRDSKHVTALCNSLKKADVNITNVSVDSNAYNLTVTGSRADLDVMFGILRRTGLTPDRRPVEKNAEYCCYWRSDVFKVWVWFASTSCKRVQVGTELKEMPVYDTVCED